MGKTDQLPHKFYPRPEVVGVVLGMQDANARLDPELVINLALVDFVPAAWRFSMKFSDGEKLTIMMLCDLYEHLKVKGDIDHEFVRSAITGGHLWALKWEHTGIFHGEEDNEEDAREVADILDMWSHIEGRYGQLSPDEKSQVDSAAYPHEAKFKGFDGNNEIQFGIARCLVDDMGRWARFKDRELNSHSPSIDRHRRMLNMFRPRRTSLAEDPFSQQELVDLLMA